LYSILALKLHREQCTMSALVITEDSVITPRTQYQSWWFSDVVCTLRAIVPSTDLVPTVSSLYNWFKRTKGAKPPTAYLAARGRRDKSRAHACIELLQTLVNTDRTFTRCVGEYLAECDAVRQTLDGDPKPDDFPEDLFNGASELATKCKVLRGIFGTEDVDINVTMDAEMEVMVEDNANATRDDADYIPPITHAASSLFQTPTPTTRTLEMEMVEDNADEARHDADSTPPRTHAEIPLFQTPAPATLTPFSSSELYHQVQMEARNLLNSSLTLAWRKPTDGTSHLMAIDVVADIIQEMMPTVWGVNMAVVQVNAHKGSAGEPEPAQAAKKHSRAVCMSILGLLCNSSERLYAGLRKKYTIFFWMASHGNRQVLDTLSSSGLQYTYTYRHTYRLFEKMATKAESKNAQMIAGATVGLVVIFDNFQFFQNTFDERQGVPTKMMRQGVQHSFFLQQGEQLWKSLSTTPYVAQENLTGDMILHKGISVTRDLCDVTVLDEEFLRQRRAVQLHRMLEAHCGSDVQLSAKAPAYGEAGLPGTKRWSLDFQQTPLRSMPLKMNVDLNAIKVNKQVIQDYMEYAGVEEQVGLGQICGKLLLLSCDGVPAGQIQRYLQELACTKGATINVKTVLGLWHNGWHLQDAIHKYVSPYGYMTLATLCGRTKVKRDATKGIFAVQDVFLKVVLSGMYKAALRAFLVKHVQVRECTI
jgi:hypothetical protein